MTNTLYQLAYYQIYGQLKVRLDQKMRQLTLNASNGGPAKRTTTQTNVIDRIGKKHALKKYDQFTLNTGGTRIGRSLIGLISL